MMAPRPGCPDSRRRQRGATLLLLLLLVLVAATTVFLGRQDPFSARTQRQLREADVLTQAKAALIAYAVSVQLGTTSCTGLVDCPRPGDLPCPDSDGDGRADPPCSAANKKLGRLPYIDLGLPDLRDESGERPWYAVSRNFRNNPRQNLALNSASSGTLTVRSADGTVTYDGSGTSGIVAVVIAPGAPLTRAGTVQDRAPGAAQLVAANYLDLANGEDNASFTDATTDGFIMGPITDANGSPVANDRIALITIDEILAAIERRVAREALACITRFADDPASVGGRFPWPVPLADAAAASTTGRAGTYFGRIPTAQPGNLNPALTAAPGNLAAALTQLQTAQVQVAALSPTAGQDAINQATRVATEAATAATKASKALAELIYAAYATSAAVRDAAAIAKSAANSAKSASSSNVVSRTGTAINKGILLSDAILKNGIDTFPPMLASARIGIEAALAASDYSAMEAKSQAMLGFLGRYSTPSASLAASLADAASAASTAAAAAAIADLSGSTAAEKDAASAAATNAIAKANALHAAIAGARITISFQQLSDAAAAYAVAQSALAAAATTSDAVAAAESLITAAAPLASFVTTASTASASLLALRDAAVSGLGSASAAATTLITNPSSGTMTSAKSAALNALNAITDLGNGIAANGDNLARESLQTELTELGTLLAAYPASTTLVQLQDAAEALLDLETDIYNQAAAVVGSSFENSGSTYDAAAAAKSAAASITDAAANGQAGSALADELGEAINRANTALIRFADFSAAAYTDDGLLFVSGNALPIASWPGVNGSCDWLNAGVPSWGDSNQWRNSILYQIGDISGTMPGRLSAGARSGLRVVVVMHGRALAVNAARPSGGSTDVLAYLEGTVNGHASRSGLGNNPSLKFEQQPTGTAFNDQLAY